MAIEGTGDGRGPLQRRGTTAGYCLICRSPYRMAIDRAILEGRLSYRAIARLYGVGDTTLARHRQRGHVLPEAIHAEPAVPDNHVLSGRTPPPVAALPADVPDAVATLADLARRLSEQIAAAEMRAASAKPTQTATLRLPALYHRELRDTLRLLAEVQGKLPGAGTTVNVGVAWAEVREVIMIATEGYPEVRARIAAALIARGSAPEPSVTPEPAGGPALAPPGDREPPPPRAPAPGPKSSPHPQPSGGDPGKGGP